MDSASQLREALRVLLRALEADDADRDTDLVTRLRRALPAEPSKPRDENALRRAINRDFIRTHIAPELELYWRRNGGPGD